jgi:hypothetical protein
MTLTLTIEMDNVAFFPDPNDEVARILRDLAARFDNNQFKIRYLGSLVSLLDVNGNYVGNVVVSED